MTERGFPGANAHGIRQLRGEVTAATMAWMFVCGIDTGNTPSGSAAATISGNAITNLSTNSSSVGESNGSVSASASAS